MAKKIDGVIEAVRYTPDGKVTMVRAYERFGPAFADRVLLDRPMLVERIRKGKRFVIGERVQLMGGTFDLGAMVRLAGDKNNPVLVTGARDGERDRLEGAPLF